MFLAVDKELCPGNQNFKVEYYWLPFQNSYHSIFSVLKVSGSVNFNVNVNVNVNPTVRVSLTIWINVEKGEKYKESKKSLGSWLLLVSCPTRLSREQRNIAKRSVRLLPEVSGCNVIYWGDMRELPELLKLLRSMNFTYYWPSTKSTLNIVSRTGCVCWNPCAPFSLSHPKV